MKTILALMLKGVIFWGNFNSFNLSFYNDKNSFKRNKII